MPPKFGNKAAFFAAYKACGTVREAARAAGIDRGMHYRLLENNPAYKKAFEDLRAQFALGWAIAAEKTVVNAREDRLHKEIRLLANRVDNLRKHIYRRLSAIDARLSEGKTVPRSRNQRPDEGDALLDQIAHGMAKKRFSKLNPTHQEAVRSIAAKIRVDQPD
jgi:hypothetical protein